MLACDSKQWLFDKQTFQVVASFDTVGVEAAFPVNKWSDDQLVIVRNAVDVFEWYLMDTTYGYNTPLQLYFTMQGTPNSRIR